RPHVSRRIAPPLDLAVVEGPAGERKEDRIPPAHACDVADLLQVRPVNDVADRTIATRDRPVHQPCARFRPRQKRGTADLPPADTVFEIRNDVHVCWELAPGAAVTQRLFPFVSGNTALAL